MTFALSFISPSFQPGFSQSRHTQRYGNVRSSTTVRTRCPFSVAGHRRHALFDHPNSARRWSMSSSRPEYDKENNENVEPSPEDERLQSELRAKVDELFGSRQNVKIDVNTDVSQAEFSLRNPTLSRSASSTSSSSVDWFRSPRYILTFIAVVSLVTGTFFTGLYMTGFVHGFDPSDDSHYEMPTYGKDSYIDPYQLLEDESVNHIPYQNPKTNSKTTESVQ